MNNRITSFLQNQRVASICCVDETGNPYCFSCFYVLDEEEMLLCFKTKTDTKHAPLLKQHKNIAGTIQPDKLNPLAIQGVQFLGFVNHDPLLTEKAGSLYHKKYPFALAMSGEMMVIQLNHIKMTDNTLGFGKKLIWEKQFKQEAI